MSSSGNPSSSGGGGGGGGGGGPCGACKFLRRKCVAGCIFAPYFDSEQGSAHFAAVHKVFGASNVSKLLQHVPEHKRPDAVVSICFEAQARLRDPIFGCVSHIISLQQQVVSLQTEISYLQAHLATLELPQPPPAPVSSSESPPPLSISDLPTISSSVYDLSSIIFEPMSSTWAMQQQPRPSDHIFGVPSSSNMGGSGGGELQALAREFLHGGEMVAHQPSPGTSGSASTVVKRK